MVKSKDPQQTVHCTDILYTWFLILSDHSKRFYSSFFVSDSWPHQIPPALRLIDKMSPCRITWSSHWMIQGQGTKLFRISVYFLTSEEFHGILHWEGGLTKMELVSYCSESVPRRWRVEATFSCFIMIQKVVGETWVYTKAVLWSCAQPILTPVW